jgi:hypothetical protein
MKRSHLVFPLLLLAASAAARADLVLSEAPQPGAFSLVSTDQAPIDLCYDVSDATVVRIAADLLAGDLEKVTGRKPALHPSNAKRDAVTSHAIYLGTLGHSPALDAIIKDRHIDTSAIAGKWESFLITTVEKPAPGVDAALLIIGADRRGTAFGALTLSEQIGVSPWNWWADVPVSHHDALFVSTGRAPHVQPPPSVKYRGIFLNDEDWGLQPWAAKTVEPDLVRNPGKGGKSGKGDIGPKTYARIFELLLRLRANFCWPAMHDVTNAFNLYPENRQVADDYAIVMGSSHCEPLLRNGVSEWGHADERNYNYVTNKQGVLDYWKQRVEENGKFENVYTLGMRGIHDSDMAGPKPVPQRVELLSQIISDQRDLLSQFVNKDVTKVPQIFCPYKEVLTLYQNGVKLPDDVTLVWADDNHGYIRQLSTPEEQKRAGGSGVYYHLSYWGRPHDYLWLSTTPPALVWEELSKAADYNARNLWVINVGDLKPAEIDLTLAMNMAYDTAHYTPATINQFLSDFFTKTFGKEHAAEMASLMDTYYHLNYQRKPEHLGFNTSQNPGGPIQPTEFSTDEIHERLDAFAALLQATNGLYSKLPANQKDAFYELVVYPVRCSAYQNAKLLNADLAARTADSPAKSEAYAAQSKAAYDAIQKETDYYNNTLAGGKWKYMMSDNPHNQDVFKLPKIAQNVAAAPLTEPPANMKPQLDSPSLPGSTYAEHAGYLSIPAESPTANLPRNNAQWTVIKSLGRLGDSLAVFPTTTPSVPDPKLYKTNSPELQYTFATTTDAPKASLTVQAIPTHRINPERGLRYAAQIDDEAPQIVDLETPENSAIWSTNVLRGAAFGTTIHALRPGQHTLHIYMVDPGVVLDHLTIDLGGLPKSYLPPAATVAAK